MTEDELNEDLSTLHANDIAYKFVTIGILELLVEKGLVTNKDVRLMVERRSTRVMNLAEEKGFDLAEGEEIHRTIGNILSDIADSFDK